MYNNNKHPTKNTTYLNLTKLFYHLLQLLHHISILTSQQNGQYTKAFSNKVHHLNWFIKPACSDHQIKTKINQINQTWVSQISSALVSHYSAIVSALQNQILALNLSSKITQEICEKTIYRARRRFGKKLSHSTLEQFRNILFLISKGQTTTLKTQPKPHSPTTHKPTKSQNSTSSSKPQPPITPINHKPQHPITPINQTPTPQPSTSNNSPQTHTPVRLVKGFRDPLSNFYPCKFRYNGTTYNSVEHCYQSLKAQHHHHYDLAELIVAQKTAADAKRLGKFPVHYSWTQQKFSIVFTLLKHKWFVVPKFRQELSALHEVEIVHPVPDSEWGTGNDGKGQNMFGILLKNVLNLIEPVPTNNTTNLKKQSLSTKHTPTNNPPTTLKNTPTYSKHTSSTKTPHTTNNSPFKTPKHPTTSKKTHFTPTPISTSNRFSLLLPPTTPSTSSTPKSSSLSPPHSKHTPKPKPQPNHSSLSQHTPKQTKNPKQPKPTPLSPPLTQHTPTQTKTPPKPYTTPKQTNTPTSHTSPPLSISHFPPLSPSLSQPLPLTTTPTNTSTSPLSSSQPTSFPPTKKRKRIVFRPHPCPLYPPLNHLTPTNKRPHSPNTSPSPKTSSPPTKQRKCAAPPKRSTSEVKPSYYKTSHKTTWRWPKHEKPILVIGASNLNRITKSSSDQIEIHSYPGARFSNFTDMLKHLNGETVQNHPKSIILNVGINDRSSNPEGTSIRNFKTMMGHIVSKFPHSSIHPVVTNYSQNLSTYNRINLDKLNDAILQYPNVHAIPKLHDSLFRVNERDNIHWTVETANAFLAHWLSELHSLN